MKKEYLRLVITLGIFVLLLFCNLISFQDSKNLSKIDENCLFDNEDSGKLFNCSKVNSFKEFMEKRNG
jgi:hypothetical protein